MLRNALSHSLSQLIVIFHALDKLSPEEGDRLYLNSSAGRHIRHINDHFIALQNGLPAGCVDYNQRHRESQIERDRHLARRQVEALLRWSEQGDSDDRPLLIFSEIDCLQMQHARFKSSLRRELLYLINHTIHHIAHIKLLLSNYGLILPDQIGLAPATATFLREGSVKKGTGLCVP